MTDEEFVDFLLSDNAPPPLPRSLCPSPRYLLVEAPFELWTDPCTAEETHCVAGEHVLDQMSRHFVATFRDVRLPICESCLESCVIFPVRSQSQSFVINYGIGIKGAAPSWRVIKVDGSVVPARDFSFYGIQGTVEAFYRNQWQQVKHARGLFHPPK